MTRREFSDLVKQALTNLPERFKKYLENIQLIVAYWPTEGQQKLYPDRLIFGLYQGIPRTNREVKYRAVLPDKITIFQGPIELICKTPAKIKAEVEKTVMHEIAHYFGMDDNHLRKIGY